MTSADDHENTLTVRRLIPVPREQVFAAWLDPVSMGTWMRPADGTTTTVELDPRVGGSFSIVMAHGRGTTEHWGEYLTIDPPSLLSFTWISSNTNRLPTVVTVELIERGSSTEVVLTHRQLPPDRVEAHRNGWTDIVRQLGERLTT
jgi:uncharacterized protein YndB with AHSA1/START domain